MSATHVQFLLHEQGGHFSKASVPVPKPEADEVSVRTKAIALNPIDWKMRSLGMRVESWPVLLGCDYSGVIESVGPNVKHLKPGDEVFGLRSMGSRGSAFQEIVTVPSTLVGKKPASMSFEDASSLPLCYLTAAAAIVIGLHVSLPYVKATQSNSPRSVLVLGGSSAVGAAAIQILREVLPSATILTTSSAGHHAALKSLGANDCFERSAQSDPAAIRAATPGGQGVDAILDAVGGAAQEPAVFNALNSDGPKLFSEVATGATIQAPNGVQHKVIVSTELLFMDGGSAAMSALSALVESGKYKLPVKVDVVGKGFEAVETGLDLLEQGVSGKKLVVSVA